MGRGEEGRRWGRHPCAGFTMVELMVAIAVLLVAVMTAFSTQLTSMNLMTTSRETNFAAAELQACMEQVLLLPTSKIPIQESEFAAGRPVARYTDLNLQNEEIVATYPGYVAGGPIPDPLPIVLTITWTDGQGRARNMMLRSMKVR